MSSLQQVGPRQFDLRFWDHSKRNFDIEALFDCNIVAGPPARWTLWPSESEGSGLRVGEGGEWLVAAGQPFSVALELTDQYGNKFVSPCGHTARKHTPWHTCHGKVSWKLCCELMLMLAGTKDRTQFCSLNVLLSNTHVES
jgi:hypothetical protein